MQKTRTLNPELYEAVGWSALLLWWGVRLLLPSLPEGTGLLGTGLILIGLNAARSIAGIPTRWGTTAVGILVIVWGALELLGTFMHLATEFGIAILLITCGLILLVRILQRSNAA